MFKQIAPVIVLSVLSGCTLMNGQENHLATLAAIQQSESNINNHLKKLELQISNQMDYIGTLELQIVSLNEQIQQLQKATSDLDDSVEAVAPAVEPLTVTTPKPHNEVVLGEVERVSIDAINRIFDARVDTGAATSSLNAVDIQEFERNGKKWVRFHLAVTDDVEKDTPWIEAPVLRYVRIRQANSDKAERRPVIELWVKLGDIHEKTPFTLADRSQMDHAILLGREFIRDIALVDVSKKFIHLDKTPDDASDKSKQNKANQK